MIGVKEVYIDGTYGVNKYVYIPNQKSVDYGFNFNVSSFYQKSGSVAIDPTIGKVTLNVGYSGNDLPLDITGIYYHK